MRIPEFGERIEGIDYRERKAVYALVPDGHGKIGVINTLRGNFLPGGGLEKGETFEECLKRELLEETGYGIDIKGFVGSAVIYEYAARIETYLKGIGYFYLASLSEKVCEPKEDDHNFVWIGIEEAGDTMLLRHQAWAIEQIRYEK